jgi:hypothetical protein
MEKQIEKLKELYGEDGYDDCNRLALEMSEGYLSIEDEETVYLRIFLLKNKCDPVKMMKKIDGKELDRADTPEKFMEYLAKIAC